MTILDIFRCVFAIAWVIVIPRLVAPLETAYIRRQQEDAREVRRGFRVVYGEEIE